MSIFDDMVSVPLRASTALQSAVLAFVLSVSKSTGYRHVVVYFLDCVCFRLESLSCLGHGGACKLRVATAAS